MAEWLVCDIPNGWFATFRKTIVLGGIIRTAGLGHSEWLNGWFAIFRTAGLRHSEWLVCDIAISGSVFQFRLTINSYKYCYEYDDVDNHVII